MRVSVLYFGVLKDVFLRDGEILDLPPGASVATLLEQYRRRAEDRIHWLGGVAVAVNQEYARPSQSLADGDEVALLPPVSGGTAGPLTQERRFVSGAQVALTTEPIEPELLTAALKRGEDGAVVVFDGMVRNNTRGRRTLFLFYEAYEAMALAQMRKLAQDAVARFEVREVALVHRLGKLAVGETSVWIGVASAHRPQAFEACRWLIDSLKTTVPIWKREHFEDGAVWSDGEPFPEDIAAVEHRERTP